MVIARPIEWGGIGGLVDFRESTVLNFLMIDNFELRVNFRILS